MNTDLLYDDQGKVQLCKFRCEPLPYANAAELLADIDRAQADLQIRDAAPQLLAALKALVEAVEHGEDEDWRCLLAEATHARAAIAAAEAAPQAAAESAV